MKYVVNFSGGVSSWATARTLINQGITPSVVFSDVRMEDEDLYRFKDDCEKNLGLEFIVICEGRTPWDVFFDEKFIGNSRADLCSRILKRELLDAFHEKNGTDRRCIGYTAGEESRAETLKAFMGDKVCFPLIDAGLTKDDCKDMAESEGLVLPRLYDLGFEHNNCGGFCIKAGHKQFKLLLEVFPERYAFHERKEEEARALIGKDVSILRDRRSGAPKSQLTLREFRRRHQNNEPLDAAGGNGCSCMEYKGRKS